MYVTSGFSLKHGPLCRYRANHLHIRRVVSSNIALTKSERKLFSNHIFYPISGLISTFQSKKPDLLGQKKQDFSMVSWDIPDCLERSEMLSGLNIYYLEVSEMIFYHHNSCLPVTDWIFWAATMSDQKSTETPLEWGSEFVPKTCLLVWSSHPVFVLELLVTFSEIKIFWS